MLLSTLSSCSESEQTRLNITPIVDAGADLFVEEGATIQLSGTITDPDGDDLQFSWTQIDGPAAKLSDPNSLDTSVSIPEIPVGETTLLTLRLTATDSVSTASDELTITVESTDFLIFRATVQPGNTDTLFKYDSRNQTLVSLAGFPGGRILDIQLSPDEQFVAFSASSAGLNSYVLYVVDISGGDPIQVSVATPNTNTTVTSFDWSPASDSLVYAANVETPFQFDSFVVDRLGISSTLITADRDTAGGVLDVVWSPNGRYVMQLKNPRSTRSGVEIYDSTRDLSNNTLQTPPEGFSEIWESVWSPDGLRLTFSAVGNAGSTVKNAFSLHPDGSGLTIMNEDGRANAVADFEWAPDSSAFLYSTFNDGTELFVSPPSGRPSIRIHPPIPDRTRAVEQFAWSPASTQVAYTADFQIDNNVELYTTTPNGLDTTKVSEFSESGRVRQFAWSPNGRWLVYSSLILSSASDFRVYVTSPTGDVSERVSAQGSVAELPRGVRGGQSSWAPDSSHVAFLQDERLAIAAIDQLDAPATAPSQVVSTTKLHPDRLHWSRDSCRIAYFGVGPAGTTELRIIRPDGLDEQVLFSGPLGSIDADSLIWSQ